ncbi:septum formation protein Maf [Pontibacter sp. BT310]|uniref:dTTP/UTP pyrophosphatase n=1 Tax=Pontibacter populi TaxID=890055 RepID=A0ABS6XGW5_9BACT|nr:MULTISPECIES: Maf family nucleotide pyrophosphatase [Pontibacter]MBJ6120056.1 septum formation protein Maf [Pontibacter sp. BT310]MBR0572485.1 septum formation protein Maf [Microvirga sp. STS03]MBW3366909.1 Maf family nucleotide pyrophosphatase [Pontibacter populi]
MNLSRPLLLASNSPRRKELLTGLGLTFEVKIKEVHEDFPAELKREQVAEFLASHKADQYLEDLEDQILLTADTIVCLGDQVLNKPADYEQAYDMLRSLSGTHHEVITGVCILTRESKTVFHDTTKVYFKELSHQEIDYYITNYKPYDKAGAYGIQEWIGKIGIERIEGSYFNVVGLPVQKLYHQLTELGLLKID